MAHGNSIKDDGMNELKAGLRDASWYEKPGRARTYHIVKDDSPACNSNSALIDEGSLTDASKIPVHLRCNRPGCRQSWPENIKEK